MYSNTQAVQKVHIRGVQKVHEAQLLVVCTSKYTKQRQQEASSNMLQQSQKKSREPFIAKKAT